MRERIRQFCLTCRREHRKINELSRDCAGEAYEKLRPQNPVIRHAWQFANQWVEDSLYEIEEDIDYQLLMNRINDKRIEAMHEIWTELGFEGVKKLITSSNEAEIVGNYVSSCLPEVIDKINFIYQCLTVDEHLLGETNRCLQGFVLTIKDESRTEVLRATANMLSTDEQIRLFLCAPFQVPTWRLLSEYSENHRSEYWKNVVPTWELRNPDELAEIVDNLLKVRRPRAAFHAVRRSFHELETSRLKQLLYEVATVDSESTSYWGLESYYISKALNSLDGRTDVSLEEMARLKFFFIHVIDLDDNEHGIRNLESLVAKSPTLFAQMVATVYKRNDDGEDPTELKFLNQVQQTSLKSAAYRLLDHISIIPGTNNNGKIDIVTLTDWLIETRHLCQKYGRSVIGDQCLGQLWLGLLSIKMVCGLAEKFVK
ncbi:hypothetical protein [Paenibacillus sp. 481]|uniref:hypothetical protein n=1 Tax=Paenibacillus sp. 481 TaxID=2835869 RepID=UPI001E4D3A36|nr:hypothetical protein [Paenibacillus sp. 481]UHA73288.1 hypothetical protein KIK04_22370 [Paenibacillus sp. 481]